MNLSDGKFFIVPRWIRLRLRKVGTRRGQTLVEYALILALISIVAISVLISLGTNLRSLYTMIDSQVSRGTTGS